MVDVYLIKIPSDEKEKEDFFSDNAHLLPKALVKKLSNTKDTATKYERLYSYTLLRCALKEYGVSDKNLCESLSFNENGKPFLSGFDVGFSLSHTNGLAAVAVIRDGQIGTDVEKINFEKEEKLKKITARFCKDNSFEANSKNFAKKYLVGISRGCIYKTEISSGLPKNENGAFVKWTALESVLKYIGGGFSCINDAGKYLNGIAVESTLISFDGNEYALSVAITNFG